MSKQHASYLLALQSGMTPAEAQKATQSKREEPTT